MIVGHQKNIDKLVAEAQNLSLHHCQIFLGPANIGKSKIALMLATKMQCENDNDIILKKLIAEGADADTIILKDDGEIIPIEKIREIVFRSTLSHTKPYLIFIIENIGRLKIESMNALLKTLEEPKKDCYFFMTVNREEDIIDTIKSRSQIRRFYSVPETELLKMCHDNPYNDELIFFAMGKPGKLVRLMSDNDYFVKQKEMYLDLSKFIDSPTLSSACELSRKYEKDRCLNDFMDILLSKSRSSLLSKNKILSTVHLDFTKTIYEIENAKDDIMKNVNPRLCLENILIPFVP